MLFLVCLSLLLGARCGSGLLLTHPRKRASAGIPKTERQTLPEHLIDCAANPILADLYGGGGSPYCFQSHPGLFTGFGSILEQTLTIGFLVSSYFFFKRSQGGIIDWNETQVTDEDEEDDYGDSEDRDLFEPNVDDSPEFTEAFERMRFKRQRQMQRKRNCPQCGGSGSFSWTGPAKVCDMCVGTGTLDIPSASSTLGMRGSRALPPLISGRSPKDD